MSTTSDRPAITEDEAEQLAKLNARVISMRNQQVDGEPVLIFDKQNPDAWVQSDYTVEVGCRD
ncbi:hypothetical protein NDI85_19835 [Halomicroarcula sp. S1AR25-4]|uniref:DUF7331 family protein n=1 Tax=Haloarcula sp. S1AR25-4 TaxID=2950538 RepID=UPI0028740332|nr:hypothetical protein [Halomicroarcula sp. S1AR25-4]MDS0280039.1 hypothetical protein [Halomicroarcula sp. S1AR25-4]